MNKLMLAALIIGSIFGFGILTALWICVFLGINGEILASVTTFSFAYLGAFLYAIVNFIKSKIGQTSGD